MNNKTIAILESRLGTQLADLVSRQGGRPMLAPALAEVPDVDSAYIARLIDELESAPARLAIFQTGVGTRALFDATDALGATARLQKLLAEGKVAARGPKPTGALRSRGVRIDFSARDPYTTVEVLEALQDMQLDGARVIVQRHGGPNEELDHALHARGAQVIEIPTYHWALPENTAPLVALIDALEGDSIDATVFTSASQAYNLFSLADKLGRKATLAANLNRTLVASIGPVCTAALKEFGVAIAIEASPPKLGPLVAALDQALSR